MKDPADLCIVVGDVTSTMACSIAAKKLHMKVAHVEGGIRSGDMTMPEEVNRIVTDSITDYFYTTSAKANQTLRSTGVKPDQIIFVGNTMIDTLIKNLERLQKPVFWEEEGLEPGNYVTLTLHRPNNVDGEEQLRRMLKEICAAAKEHKVVFPVHPRTRKSLESVNLNHDNLYMTGPMSYLEFNYLVKNSWVSGFWMSDRIGPKTSS